MPRVPGQLWINLFDDGEAGTHCRTVHGRQDAAAEEIADWRQGLAWQGYAYPGTLWSVTGRSGRRFGIVDLEPVLIE